MFMRTLMHKRYMKLIELGCLQIIIIYKKWCPLKISHNFDTI